jgi:hypothetical protein
MANTVSILSYSNTFGNWLTTTNELANEINTLGSGNYTKDTGILVLNGAGTGLQVSNNALFTSNVIITGAGQALQVTNDAIISGNLTVLGNTNLTIESVSMDEMITGNLIVNGTISGNGATLLQSDILSAALALSVALG